MSRVTFTPAPPQPATTSPAAAAPATHGRPGMRGDVRTESDMFTNPNKPASDAPRDARHALPDAAPLIAGLPYLRPLPALPALPTRPRQPDDALVLLVNDHFVRAAYAPPLGEDDGPAACAAAHTRLYLNLLYYLCTDGRTRAARPISHTRVVTALPPTHRPHDEYADADATGVGMIPSALVAEAAPTPLHARHQGAAAPDVDSSDDESVAALYKVPRTPPPSPVHSGALSPAPSPPPSPAHAPGSSSSPPSRAGLSRLDDVSTVAAARGDADAVLAALLRDNAARCAGRTVALVPARAQHVAAVRAAVQQGCVVELWYPLAGLSGAGADAEAFRDLRESRNVRVRLLPRVADSLVRDDDDAVPPRAGVRRRRTDGRRASRVA